MNLNHVYIINDDVWVAFSCMKKTFIFIIAYEMFVRLKREDAHFYRHIYWYSVGYKVEI